MITAITPYTDPRTRALPGQGFDGVVLVAVGGYYGSGALLYDGRAVLTAAHLFDDLGTDALVRFETADDGVQVIDSSRVSVHPGYDPDDNNDLALVWLSSSAPTSAERYNLYRDADEIGQTMILSGYGWPGTGAQGMLSVPDGGPLRRKAVNRADTDAETLFSYLGWSLMSWTPEAGTQLVADFDDGTAEHDALGVLIGRHDTGLGLFEGLISPGDSGGPAFIDGRMAGIASYTANLKRGTADPDIDDSSNSSFGEIAAWQRLSHYQQWIDQSLREAYPDAPTNRSEVRKVVAERDDGTTLAYFLLEFTGVRGDPEQVLSVDFATRDGSARAGEDYLATAGRLNLYPGENQAVIPVEIIGDCAVETNEIFYLDVTNPVGGGFGDGVVKLTAVRTIVDDDGGLLA